MKTKRPRNPLAAALVALAGVSVAVVARDAAASADAGNTGTEESSLALKLHNPISDLITVPMENDFEFTSGSWHALTYTLNVQPVMRSMSLALRRGASGSP